MIWGYHYFRKHPYMFIFTPAWEDDLVGSTTNDLWFLPAPRATGPGRQIAGCGGGIDAWLGIYGKIWPEIRQNMLKYGRKYGERWGFKAFYSPNLVFFWGGKINPFLTNGFCWKHVENDGSHLGMKEGGNDEDLRRLPSCLDLIWLKRIHWNMDLLSSWLLDCILKILLIQYLHDT